MRLFIATKFKPDFERVLRDLQNEMREHGITGNYTKCQNLHMTLAFIGEYNNPERVIEALKDVSFEPLRLSLNERLGNYGDILWVGMNNNPNLMSLNMKIRRALDNYDITYDRKAFRPHITIIRKARLNADLEKYLNDKRIEKADMIADEFSLVQSLRIDGKLVYKDLCSFKARRM